MDLNHRGSPYAVLNEGTPGEVWVTDDRMDRGYGAIWSWQFHRGDELVLSVSKHAVGETPSVELLSALLNAHDAGVRAGRRQGMRDGQTWLQRRLRQALGIPAPDDEAADALDRVYSGMISREEAERIMAIRP